MAYTIHHVLKINPGKPADIGPMLDAGQTRAQVLQALARLALLRPGASFGSPMPRYGHALIVGEPGIPQPFMIWHH